MKRMKNLNVTVEDAVEKLPPSQRLSLVSERERETHRVLTLLISYIYGSMNMSFDLVLEIVIMYKTKWLSTCCLIVLIGTDNHYGHNQYITQSRAFRRRLRISQFCIRFYT